LISLSALRCSTDLNLNVKRSVGGFVTLQEIVSGGEVGAAVHSEHACNNRMTFPTAVRPKSTTWAFSLSLSLSLIPPSHSCLLCLPRMSGVV